MSDEQSACVDNERRLGQLYERRRHLYSMMNDSQEHAQIIHYEKRIEFVDELIRELGGR